MPVQVESNPVRLAVVEVVLRSGAIVRAEIDTDGE
jgi:hypothetical protein